MDIVKNFEAATGKDSLFYQTTRTGSVATCYSDATKAKKELGWEAEYDYIKDMCADYGTSSRRTRTVAKTNVPTDVLPIII